MKKGLGNRPLLHCMGHCSIFRPFLVAPGMGGYAWFWRCGGQSLICDMALNIVNDLHDGYDLLFGIC